MSSVTDSSDAGNHSSTPDDPLAAVPPDANTSQTVADDMQTADGTVSSSPPAAFACVPLPAFTEVPMVPEDVTPAPRRRARRRCQSADTEHHDGRHAEDADGQPPPAATPPQRRIAKAIDELKSQE